jgi:hypothetical protein
MNPFAGNDGVGPIDNIVDTAATFVGDEVSDFYLVELVRPFLIRLLVVENEVRERVETPRFEHEVRTPAQSDRPYLATVPDCQDNMAVSMPADF